MTKNFIFGSSEKLIFFIQINGTGNADNNVITGTTGNNSLAGGAGNDIFPHLPNPTDQYLGE
ncbi:hypothetical protein [Anabaena sphaerica]|uniref:hypothetical protein n=1 Tax=Anabaena sphaerica TaxID=212446 RepID=UPI0018EF7CB0|nr:hypothetical protein [Anabaena sphaerica]